MNTEKEKTLLVLNQAFAWKHNSLAAYIVQAEPFVAPGEEALFEAVKAIAAEDLRLEEVIGRAIEALGESPCMPPHDPAVADLNYLSIRYLAGELVKKLHMEISSYRQSPCSSSAIAEVMQAAQAQLTRIGKC